MPKTAALRAAVFALSAKNRKGGVQTPTPPGPARVNLLPNLHRAGLVVQTAPGSFRVRFLLLMYTFLSFCPDFTNIIYFLT